MILEKETIKYHGISYPVVHFTLEKGEGERAGYPDGYSDRVADFELWRDIMDEDHNPRDEEGKEVDDSLWGYTDASVCSAWHDGDITDKEMEKEIFETI